MGGGYTRVAVVGEVDLLRRLRKVQGIDVAWSGVDAENLPDDTCRSEVAIVDLSLPPEVALDAVRAIAVRCPDTGILVAQPEEEVLGFSAQPVLATNIDGARPPVEVLYLGGNADLYVLYDPCAEFVEFVSVGSTHIQVIDEVSCP